MTDGILPPIPPPPTGGGGIPPADDGAWTPADPTSRVCIHINTVQIHPGDVLIATLPDDATCEDEHVFVSRITARFPGHQVVALRNCGLQIARPVPTPEPVKPEPQWLGGPPWPKLEPIDTWQDGVFDGALQPVTGATMGLFKDDVVYDGQTRTVKLIVDMDKIPHVFARTYLLGDDLWRDLVDAEGKVLPSSQHIWALPRKVV